MDDLSLCCINMQLFADDVDQDNIARMFVSV